MATQDQGTRGGGPGDGTRVGVVWPLGRSVGGSIDFAPRVRGGLAGKTVAELNDFEGGQYFPVIRDELKKQFPDLKVVEYPRMGATHGRYERQVIADLPSKLQELGVDVVISGVGV